MLDSLGIPDDRVTVTIDNKYPKYVSVLLRMDLSRSFFAELHKTTERSRLTYLVLPYDTNHVLINFWRR